MLSPFCGVLASACGMVLATFQVGLPTPVNGLQKHPQRFDSKVILNPIKLTTEVNYHIY